jgi:hypothetical protein
MCKSYLRIDFVRWLLQQEKEDRSGDAVVQSPPDIECSAGNADATAADVDDDVDVADSDGFMSQVVQERQAVGAMDPSCSDTEEESTSVTTTTDADDSSSKKAVSFGLIQVREYNRVVGDNPTVRVGPPMSIGWEFVQKKSVPVDDYEKTKLPRTSDLSIMGSITRQSILRYEFDVSLGEIRAAERIIRKIQRQRWHTVQQGKTTTAILYAVESVKRKMFRIFSNEPRLEKKQRL